MEARRHHPHTQLQLEVHAQPQKQQTRLTRGCDRGRGPHAHGLVR